MIRIAALLAALIVFLPQDGQCGWQYTRWGMSPEQVKSASQGAAVDNPTTPPESSGNSDALLTGTYDVDAMRFTVYFLFNRLTKKLDAVSLELTDPGKGAELYSRLTRQYGRPVSQQSNSLLRVARWIDRKNSNAIVWTTQGFLKTRLRYAALTGGGLNL